MWTARAVDVDRSSGGDVTEIVKLDFYVISWIFWLFLLEKTLFLTLEIAFHSLILWLLLNFIFVYEFYSHAWLSSFCLGFCETSRMIML